MKTAIIVGAAGGMGKAVTLALAAKGYSLALIDCNKAALNSLVDEVNDIQQKLQKQNNISALPRMLFFSINIVNSTQVRTVFQYILDTLGPIDLLFSSAGIFALDANLTPDDTQKLHNVNYFGNLNCVNTILPSMRETKHGQIIVVCSRGAVFPRAGTGLYSGSKAALQNTLESLAKSAIADKVKITTLNPAITNTPMASISSIPPEEMIQTNDIAQTVKYLLKLSQGAVINSLNIACGLDMQKIAEAETGSAYKKRM